MRKLIFISALLPIFANSSAVDTYKPYANESNGNAVDAVRNGDPWNVPNYQEPHPNYDHLMNDGDRLKLEGANATSGNEAAELIYSLPKRNTNFTDEEWYKGAQEIERDPGKVIKPDISDSQCTTEVIPGTPTVENASCIESETSVEKSCNEGVVVKVDADYDYECHKNREDEGKSCAVGRTIDVTKSFKYSCTKKEIYTSEKCEQWWEIKPSSQRICDPNWTLNGTVCTQSAIKTCPDGYTLTGSQCTRVQYDNATATCKSGYTVGQNGSITFCRQTITYSKLKQCPGGYQDAGNNLCVKYAYIDKTAQCNPGEYLLNGQCYTKQTLPLVQSCPSGYVNYNGSCVAYQYTTYQPQCAAGSYYQDGVCKTDTISVPNKVCPSGYTYSLKWDICRKNDGRRPATNTSCNGGQVETAAEDSFSPTYQGTSCMMWSTRYILASVNLICQSGHLSGSQCITTTSSTVKWVCPAGFTDDGKQCKKVSNTQPITYSCPSGSTREGDSCIKYLPGSAPKYVCPAGYNDNGTNCSKISESVSAFYICPAGTTDNGSNCLKYIDEEPTWTCNPGYEPDGNQCVKTSTIDYVYTCPVGTVDKDQCKTNSRPGAPSEIWHDECAQKGL
ncbi:hypothetical protein KAM385_46520 [Aeromonas hydrophila]|uniref:hypothetical protein n=1 Tax=Aeromonas hydrophila TaxID=644 RepID=UPI001CC33BD8|nr:hypothetical protein [Aeromonas hydrophila]GJC07623.1 hypothetical protein KAM385_46520 [Aeromonas hydrophila]